MNWWTPFNRNLIFCIRKVIPSHPNLTLVSFATSTLILQKVKDSWRVVNHRDIVPTVPHLMGYCHVAQPVYLAAGDLNDALVSTYYGLLSCWLLFLFQSFFCELGLNIEREAMLKFSIQHICSVKKNKRSQTRNYNLQYLGARSTILVPYMKYWCGYMNISSCDF